MSLGHSNDLESPGPSDFEATLTPPIHYSEPSKTKPREASIGLEGRKPRSYRPPVLDLAVAPKVEKVFVAKGTRAWDAWIVHRRRVGEIPSLPVTQGHGEHIGKTGWYLPSLFPPSSQSTGPPSSGIDETAAAEFIKQTG